MSHKFRMSCDRGQCEIWIDGKKMKNVQKLELNAGDPMKLKLTLINPDVVMNGVVLSENLEVQFKRADQSTSN